MKLSGVLLSRIPEAARLGTNNNSARIVVRETWRRADVSTFEVTPAKLSGRRTDIVAPERMTYARADRWALADLFYRVSGLVQYELSGLMVFANIMFLPFESVRRDERRGRAPQRRDSLRGAERIGTSGNEGVRVAARRDFRQG